MINDSGYIYKTKKFITQLNNKITDYNSLYCDNYKEISYRQAISKLDIKTDILVAKNAEGIKITIQSLEPTIDDFPVTDYDLIINSNKIFYIDKNTFLLNTWNDYNGDCSLSDVSEYFKTIVNFEPHNANNKLFTPLTFDQKIQFILKKKLKNKILGNNIDCRNLYRHQLIKEYIENSYAFKPSMPLRIYFFIFSSVFRHDDIQFTTNIESWNDEALDLLFTLFYLEPYYLSCQVDTNAMPVFNCSRAINYFKHQGLVVEYFAGKITPSNKSKKNIKLIDKRIAAKIKSNPHVLPFILYKLMHLPHINNANRLRFQRTISSGMSSPYIIVKHNRGAHEILILANYLYAITDDENNISSLMFLDDQRKKQIIVFEKRSSDFLIRNSSKSISMIMANDTGENTTTISKLEYFLKYSDIWSLINLLGLYTPNIEPFALALRLSIENIDSCEKLSYVGLLDNKTLTSCQSILDEITHYASLFQFLDFSSWEFGIDQENIMRKVEFDHHYILPQMPPQYFERCCKLFDFIPLDNDDFKSDVVILKQLLTSYNAYRIHQIAYPELQNKFGYAFFPRIKKISSQNVECGYLSDSSKLNSIPLALIFPQNQSIFINHPCLNLLIFEYLFNKCKSLYINRYISLEGKTKESAERSFGDVYGREAFENLIEAELINKEIKFYKGRKFKPEHNSAFSTFQQCRCKKRCNCEAESDFIIEHEKYIIIIECKTKQLSFNSKSGSDLQVLIDLLQCFLESQYQALKLKYLLLNQPEVTFTNNTNIMINNRKIYTVTISLWESFLSLMDEQTHRSIFEFVSNRNFSGNDTETDQKLVKLNKQLESIRALNLNGYSKESLFLSFQQLITALDNSSDHNSFVESLLTGSLLVTGQRDWYEKFFHCKDHGYGFF